MYIVTLANGFCLLQNLEYVSYFLSRDQIYKMTLKSPAKSAALKVWKITSLIFLHSLLNLTTVHINISYYYSFRKIFSRF